MYTEQEAGIPLSLNPGGFNQKALLPYSLSIQHVQSAMQEFLEFLALINQQLISKEIHRLESFLMPANFSSLVGEFMVANIPKYCPYIVKNWYHNGHPDLIPQNMFPDNKVQYATEGIEVKASRYERGWQGHNPESVWLLVFVFDSNRPQDTEPRPFKFKSVYSAYLEKEDWKFSGRSETSRRTITASIIQSGYDKLVQNWIYLATPNES